MLRGGTAAETGELRKHEPHPVARLATAPQLVENVFVDGILRGDEALELERHGATALKSRFASRAGSANTSISAMRSRSNVIAMTANGRPFENTTTPGLPFTLASRA